MRELLVRLLDRAESIGARATGNLPARVQLAIAGGTPTVRDGLTLAPDVQLILFLRELLHGPELSALPPEQARARMRRDGTLHGGVPTEVGSVRDLELPGAAGPLRTRLYTPPNGERAPLLVYFHGGGYVVGDLDTHDAPCRLLCAVARVNLLAVDYRLAPEAPFPAAIDDGMAAFRWALAHAEALGADPDRVAVGGDSAGGNLAAVISQLTVRERTTAPCAQLLIYPTVDRASAHRSLDTFATGFLLTRDDIAWYQRLYAGERADLADPRISPLLARDLSGLPPALVVTAGFDPLRDEGEAYAAALAKAGTPAELRRFERLVHGFVNMLGPSPSAREALRETAVRFRALLDRRQIRARSAG